LEINLIILETLKKVAAFLMNYLDSTLPNHQSENASPW